VLDYLFSAPALSVVPEASSHPLPLMDSVVLALRDERVPEPLGVQLLHHLRELLQHPLCYTEARHANGVSPPYGGGTSQKSTTFSGNSFIWA
jgi:hypothetical protein